MCDWIAMVVPEFQARMVLSGYELFLFYIDICRNTTCDILQIAHRLRGFTKMGGAPWSILSTLKNRINLYQLGRELMEETESIGIRVQRAMLNQVLNSFHSTTRLDGHFQSISD